MPFDRLRTGRSSASLVELELDQQARGARGVVAAAGERGGGSQELAAAQVVRRHEALRHVGQPAVRARASRAWMPKISTSPASAAHRSSMHLMSVVLPAPLAPTRPNASPCATSRSTPASAGSPP